MYNKDILLYLTSFLNIKDVLNLKLVCKKYYNIIYNKIVWYLLLERDFSQFLKLAKDPKQMYKEIFLYKKNLLLDWRIEKDMKTWYQNTNENNMQMFEYYTLDMTKIVCEKILKEPKNYCPAIYFDIFDATYDKDILIYGLDKFKMEYIFNVLIDYFKNKIFYDNNIRLIICKYLEKFITKEIQNLKYERMIKIFFFLDKSSKYFKLLQGKIIGNSSKTNLKHLKCSIRL